MRMPNRTTEASLPKGPYRVRNSCLSVRGFHLEAVGVRPFSPAPATCCRPGNDCVSAPVKGGQVEERLNSERAGNRIGERTLRGAWGSAAGSVRKGALGLADAWTYEVTVIADPRGLGCVMPEGGVCWPSRRRGPTRAAVFPTVLSLGKEGLSALLR